MRKIVSSILILSFSAAACTPSAKDEGHTIVTVHAEVVTYQSMAMHFDFDDGTAEWQDAVHLKIVYPPDWKEKDKLIDMMNDKEDITIKEIEDFIRNSNLKK